MANKAARERTCISCRKGAPKENFFRVARLGDGTVCINAAGGRGAYVCKNTACVLKAQKERRIERALKTKIEAGIYEKLLVLSESNK